MKKQDIFRGKCNILCFVCAAAIMMMLSGCGEEAELSSVEQGFEAVKSGNYSTAQNMFEAALTEGAGAKEVYRGMGIASLGAGDYAGAINHFGEALSLSNGIIEDMDIDISYYKAVAEYKMGEPDAAIETYNAIIGMRPKEDNAYYMRGKIYLSKGDKAKAVEDYDKAISLEPSDYDHYLRICEDLSGAGYAGEGKSYIQKALDSSSKLSNYQLGVFNYYLENYSEARNFLENARNDSNSGDDVILYLGKTYEALGDADYAVTMFEGYVSEGNPAAAAYLNIGMIKMNQLNYQGALEAFELGIEQNDGGYMQTLLYNQIVSYEYLRDFDTAKKLMAEYVIKYPGDEKALRENIFLSTR